MIVKIFKWILGVLGYTILMYLVVAASWFVSDFLDTFNKAYYSLLDSIGEWLIAPFLTTGIIIKLTKDHFKKEQSETNSAIKEYAIIIFIIIGGLTGIILLNKFLTADDQKTIYVYACPVDSSTECYEATASDPDCQYNPPDGGCEEWTTTIYFPDKESIDLLCYSGKGNKLKCLEEGSDSDKEWMIYFTDDEVE